MNDILLITGGSGFLGSNLYNLLKEKFDTYLLFHKNKPKNIYNEKILYCDALNYRELKEEISNLNPKYIINTIGLANIELSQKNKSLARRVNIDSAVNLAKISKLLKNKFIHISTDHFYGDKKGKNAESDMVILKNYYAKTKFIAEKKILLINKKNLIIRTNFFGFSFQKKTFAENILAALKNKKKINLFDDVFFTPIFVGDLSIFILMLIKANAKGIYNICTDQIISKFDFGLKLAKIYNHDSNYIVKSSIEDNKSLVIRPKNMSLSNRKLKKKLNIKKIDINKSIKNFYKYSVLSS